jgi:DNA mismatch repair protein MutL
MTDERAGTSAKIRILPPALADQIAAGEVVERPASVVKELVENALDAGARRIEVELENGGRRLIRVVDDGCGMLPDDARLALRRHATSKIAAADDLWGLRTFGFRGEALPSIAAVSRLTMTTRPAGSDAGFRLAVEAGVEIDAREAGIPVGTQVEVRDLFFNTPARAKFLKTEGTETANTSEAMVRLALAHPDVHFRLRVAGRTALDLPPHRDLGERVRVTLARRGAGALHEANGDEGGHRVRAFLASPEEVSNTTRSTYLFVGGRFVRDRSLLHALALGYGTLIEKGRYPLAALFLDLPGRDVDVNVHPQKLEVRFARAQEVYAAVRHVVGAAIARAPWLRAGDGARPMRTFTLPPQSRSATRDDGGAAPAGESAAAVFVGGAGDVTPAQVRLRGVDQGGSPLRLRDGAADVPAGSPGAASLADWGPARFFSGLTYVGQVHRTYLVCEARDELILIDQHAAHERVAYARLRAAHARAQMPRQRLLFPIPIEVGEAEAAAAERADLLGDLGFEVTRQGASTVLLRAVPEPLKDADPKPLLRDVLGELAEGGPPGRAGDLDPVDQILATIACHSVVRAGDVLGRPEALALLAQLDDVDLRSHCPHGRPVLLRLPLSEIERRFGRV